MSQRAWAATRKGLFELQRTPVGWRIARVSSPSGRPLMHIRGLSAPDREPYYIHLHAACPPWKPPRGQMRPCGT